VIHPNRFANYLAREHGLTRERTRDFFQGTFLECLLGRADLKTSIAPFLSSWGWPGTVEDYLHQWFTEEDAPDPQMVQAIATLRQRGLHCYLGTNQERYRIAYMQHRMGFGQLFDGIFASAMLGAMKPEMAFYTTITATLGVAPDTILFWDDASGNVAAARACGWNAEQYTSFESFQRVTEQYVAQYDQ